MDKEKLIDLTNRLYRQTLLFPKKEPLRYKIREAADEILARFVKGLPVAKETEALKSYFAVAKFQNWVSYFDILEIEKEYDKISLEAARGPTSGKETSAKELGSSDLSLDDRKQRILKILKEKEKIQVGELQTILADVSKRTLRRDFERLLEIGLVQRKGQKNETFYSLKSG